MSALEHMLRDPAFLPHRVDFEGGRILFVETSRARLAAASFLDGRTPVGHAAPVAVPLADALAAAPEVGGVDRIIGHVSFCGSTLLARLFDVPGSSFSYREPHALVDLADAQASVRLSGRPDPRIGPVLDLVLGQLRLGWSTGEATVVKPSNWVNSLLPLMAERSQRMQFALVGMDPRAFLVAIFRGGRDRIVYTLRALAHLQSAFPDCSEVMAAASRGDDALLNAARLAALSLCLQQQVFDRIDPAGAARLDYADITGDPAGALARASAMLGVDLSPQDRAGSVAAHASGHSKSPERAFDSAGRAEEDDRIELLHGARIDAALAWAAAVRPDLVGMKPIL